MGGASGSRQAGLADALGPGVEQLCHGVFVGQLQQLGRHVSVDRLQEAVGTWRSRRTGHVIRVHHMISCKLVDCDACDSLDYNLVCSVRFPGLPGLFQNKSRFTGVSSH